MGAKAGAAVAQNGRTSAAMLIAGSLMTHGAIHRRLIHARLRLGARVTSRYSALDDGECPGYNQLPLRLKHLQPP